MRTGGVSEAGLRHVVVVAGDGPGWAALSDARWAARVRSCAAALAEVGVPWLTMRPVHGELEPLEHSRLVGRLAQVLPGESHADGVVARPVIGGPGGGVTVLVDPRANGRSRFVDAVGRLAEAGCRADEVDEDRLASVLLAPSGVEPDLVVVLGADDRVPVSLVWELAYAELVFLDVSWEDLDASHLETALEDFARRERRFGGIDG
jgi:undecaprenyl diphosphate synthase